MEDKGTPDDFARVMAERLKKPEYASGTYEPPARQAKKSAIMAKIETREDALLVIKQTAVFFFVIAGLQAIFAMLFGISLIFDAVVYVVLAALLWRFKSRAAASLLALFAMGAAAVTVAHVLGVRVPGGTNLYLAFMAVWAAIRAVEATYRLRGQFAVVDAMAPT